MKIVLIGGGSYVFAPTVLEDIALKHKIDGCQLVVVDVYSDAARAMAKVAERMAQSVGIAVDTSYTADRKEALPGADFVIMSAAIQGARRWQMDYDILKEFGILEQARETGGLGGLSYTFRSVTLLMDICRDMEQYCPGAMLLDVTNPMPRVVTAVNRFTGIRSAGFCNMAWNGATGYEWYAGLLGRSVRDIDVVTAGLNHFAWLVEIRDKKTGEDLYPEIEKVIKTGKGREYEVMRRWLDQYGGIIAGHVDHHCDFLPFDPGVHYHTTAPFHGDTDERRKRYQEIFDAAEGKADWKPIIAHSSWEHPVDAADALYFRKDRKFDILNIPNKGYLPELPDGRIVEVPAIVEGGVLKGVKVGNLPGRVAEICRLVSDVHELASEAAVKGDRSLARGAVEIDPAISDKKTALAALDRMLEVHADILPQFGK